MAYPIRNARKHSDNIKFNPVATFGKMSNNDSLFVISISGINFNDITELNSVSDGSFQFMLKNNNDGKSLFLVVKANMLDNFLNTIPSIEQKMNELEHYNTESLNAFFVKVKDIIEQTPTAKDKEKNTENINKTWKDLLQTLKDPKVREKFLLLQTTPTFAKLFNESNLILSPNNVRRVLLSDPQATFVTNIVTWRNTFNREVIDTSQFVMIKRVDNNAISSKVMDRLPEVKAQGGWRTLCKKYHNNLDCGVLYGLIKKARKTFNLGELFYESKVYDVRNTRLIPGMEDKFLTVPGLVNNLSGEINQGAMALKTKEYEEKNEPMPDLNAKTDGVSERKLTIFKNNLMKMCETKGLKVIDLGNDADTILECAYQYALNASSALNILKDSNKQQFAASLALVVAHSLGIDSQLMRKYMNYIPSIHNEESLNDLSTKIHGVYMQIMTQKSDVNESTINEAKLMSSEDIANLLKHLQKQSVKESKDRVINLINRLENI